MRRGDVVRAQLPRPAGSPGREQFGTRPAVVLQDEPGFAGLPTVIVVPLTSRMSATRFPGALVVQPSAANGLDVQSVVLCHQVRALDKRRVEAVIGRLSHEDVSLLEAELRRLMGL